MKTELHMISRMLSVWNFLCVPRSNCYKTGKICIVEDKQEKIRGLNILMKQASGSPEWQYSEKMINADIIVQDSIKTNRKLSRWCELI
jgi:hypothetical protein